LERFLTQRFFETAEEMTISIARPLMVALALTWALSEGPVQAQVPPATTDSTSSLIELRVAREVPAPGLLRVSSPVLGEGRDIYVEKTAFLQAEGITFASVAAQPGRLVIALELTDEAASRMTEATAANVGRQAAVFFGSRLLSSTRIIEPLRSKHVQVAVEISSLPPGLSEEIASRIAARWPRRK
jgi:hypothetical protein